MGCCLSKNDPCSNSHSQIEQTDTKKNLPVPVPVPITVKLEHPKKQLAGFEAAAPKPECSTKEIESETKEVFTKKKKEVFVIQHRKSNDNRPETDGSASNSSNSSDPSRGSGSEEIGRNILAAAANGQAVRTSSCTKEEVDAILIQCGRLSRSSSGKGNGNGNGNGHGRRYSGSKRSFDFDRENDIVEDSKRIGNGNGNEDELNDDDERLRRRQSRGSNRRRTTPSRSRERDQQQQQRSGSKERSQSNGRRVSRSPGRRSESPITQTHNGNNGNVRPGKLVSVPATVSSLSVEKGSIGNGSDGNVKRVLVKRNVGSPRSQSPARPISPARASSPVRGGNQGNGGGQQQPVSAPLSRNGSRKAEHSPFRRTPLNEIDINSLPFHPLSNKRPVSKGKEIEEDVVVVKQPVNSGFQQNKYAETNNVKASIQRTHRRSRSRGAEGYEVTKTNYCRVNELQTPNVEQMIEDKRGQLDTVEYDAMVTPVVVSGAETLKLPQTLMKLQGGHETWTSVLRLF